jgi:hypothetical protein
MPEHSIPGDRGATPGFTPPRGHPVTRAEKKFGLGKCPRCGHRFVKHRHGQRYCCDECRKAAYDLREGRVSTDPRYVGRRARRQRLKAIWGTDALLVGKRAKQPKKINKNNRSRTPFLLSRGSGLDLSGLNPKLAARMLTVELPNVPLLPAGARSALRLRQEAETAFREAAG